MTSIDTSLHRVVQLPRAWLLASECEAARAPEPEPDEPHWLDDPDAAAEYAALPTARCPSNWRSVR